MKYILNKNIHYYFFASAYLLLCFSFIDTNKYEKKVYEIIQSDTAFIRDIKYVLSVYKSDDGAAYFTVQKESGGQFKIILKDLDYWTNNSDIYFRDANKDGFKDICWDKKWQEHCYLFNPKIENFVEVGEIENIDTLKINNKNILYQKKFPLLFLIGGAKTLNVLKCSSDTLMDQVNSELFIINDDYEKISFASLDNFQTSDSIYADTINCGDQIIICYVPPYTGKYGPYNIWNSGKIIDSFLAERRDSFLYGDSYSLDSSFITNYWINHYKDLLQYGQVFKCRRLKPLTYY